MRERREVMRLGSRAAGDVPHRDVADQERIRNQRTMAAPGHGLGTQ
jgi:hypothetical protein